MFGKKPLPIPTVVNECVVSLETDDCGVINLSTSGRLLRHVTDSDVTSQVTAPSTAKKQHALGASPERQHPQPTRMLMRDWLLAQVDSNDVPGLKWFDQERTLLKIPWIHASKAVWTLDSHCRLFEKWAIYTGKYIPGSENPNPRRWKANFRCALNSLPDVKEEPSLSEKNGEHGYKVYRIHLPARPLKAEDRRGRTDWRAVYSQDTMADSHQRCRNDVIIPDRTSTPSAFRRRILKSRDERCATNAAASDATGGSDVTPATPTRHQHLSCDMTPSTDKEIASSDGASSDKNTTTTSNKTVDNTMHDETKQVKTNQTQQQLTTSPPTTVVIASTALKLTEATCAVREPSGAKRISTDEATDQSSTPATPVQPSFMPSRPLLRTPPIPLAVGELSTNSDCFVDVQNEVTVATVKRHACDVTTNSGIPSGRRLKVEFEPNSSSTGSSSHGAKHRATNRSNKDVQQRKPAKHIEGIVGLMPSPVSRYGDHCYYMYQKN